MLLNDEVHDRDTSLGVGFDADVCKSHSEMRIVEEWEDFDVKIMQY